MQAEGVDETKEPFHFSVSSLFSLGGGGGGRSQKENVTKLEHERTYC